MPSLKDAVQLFARKVGRANEDLQTALNRRQPKLLRRYAELLKLHGQELVAIPPDLDSTDYVEAELERALGPRPFEPGPLDKRRAVLAAWDGWQAQVKRRLRRVMTGTYEIDVDEFSEDRFLDMVDFGLTQMAIEIAKYGQDILAQDVRAQRETMTGVTIIDAPRLSVKVEAFTMRYFIYALVFCHLKKRN